ncbi:MAG: GNAT family N-acetyltransferase [Bacillota bacterium]
MIRKLADIDKEMTMAFLQEESAFNLFIIGDIENFGMETDFMKIYGDFDNEVELKAVLLRFFNFFILYAKDNDYDIHGMAQIMKEHGNIECLSGKKGIIDAFIEHSSFQIEKQQDTYFVRLVKPVKELASHSPLEAVKGRVEDVDDVADLLRTIVEFGEFSESTRGSIKREIQNGGGRIFLVRYENKVIATARTAAENSCSAMIVGVATREEYRNQGLASQCMTTLCKELQAEGKEICLFYDNPKAGSIYRALGFEDVGMWTMLKKVAINP